ncbi:MAG: hypothetical protein KGJ80_12795 [Chloroflexota bacterium]|nr:hypothetical protein [Chloroflexota bacterium]
MIGWRVTLAFALVVLAMLACEIGPAARTTPTAPLPAPTALPPATPLPTRAPPSAAPAWWPRDLEMPKGAEFIGDAKRTVWSTRDLGVKGLRDFFIGEGTRAGYQPFSVTLSEGSIYDLFFVKGADAFGVNLTQGIDATFITASRVGIFHLKVSGVANLQVDLPMRSRLDTTPGSEISIGTSLPNAECAGCQYYVNVHIAPFKGVGAYDSKPGAYIIDVELIPGGTAEQDDYRWAQSCSVVVKDVQTGTFDCRGLQNVNDQSRKLDVSGSWAQ